MARWGRIAAAYALLTVMATTVALVWRDGSLLVHPEPWLELSVGAGHAYSLLSGLGVGGLVVVLTRIAVPRLAPLRNLHADLRPIAKHIPPVGIVVLAVLSSLGEEVLFRGLLQPWVGLLAQAALFGIVHFVPGRSRWVWVSWATAMGLVLGAMFQLSGSLLGPLAAHALINGVNLAYLRSHDPDPQRRSLGGLLDARESAVRARY